MYLLPPALPTFPKTLIRRSASCRVRAVPGVVNATRFVVLDVLVHIRHTPQAQAALRTSEPSVGDERLSTERPVVVLHGLLVRQLRGAVTGEFPGRRARGSSREPGLGLPEFGDGPAASHFPGPTRERDGGREALPSCAFGRSVRPQRRLPVAGRPSVERRTRHASLAQAEWSRADVLSRSRLLRLPRRYRHRNGSQCRWYRCSLPPPGATCRDDSPPPFRFHFRREDWGLAYLRLPAG